MIKNIGIPDYITNYQNAMQKMPKLTNDHRYPSKMVLPKPDYENDPSIYDSPNYSDLHPPIFCSSESLMNQIIQNMYKVPDDLSDVLGGENVIKRYSQLVTSSIINRMNLEKYNVNIPYPDYIIRCPFDLCFQRNQHPNSLFNLVKTRKIKIEVLDFGSVHIIIKNLLAIALFYFFPIGSIVDTPYHTQPIYVTEELSGTLELGESAEHSLGWHCMCNSDSPPSTKSKLKLTPFVLTAPENLCNESGCYSHRFWDEVQPNRSNRLSATNDLWNQIPNDLWNQIPNDPPMQKSTQEKNVNEKEWIYPKAKNGGYIAHSLYKILNNNRNKKFSVVDGVSFSKPKLGQKELGTYRLPVKSGIVVKLEDGQNILIKKNKSSFWEGGPCKYDPNNDTYLFNKTEYSKEWTENLDNKYCGSIISAMLTDPKKFSFRHNAQDSRQHLMAELGKSVPSSSCFKIIADGLYDLAYDMTEKASWYEYSYPYYGTFLTYLFNYRCLRDLDAKNFGESVGEQLLRKAGFKVAGSNLKNIGKTATASKKLGSETVNAGKDLLKNRSNNKIEFKKNVAKAKKEKSGPEFNKEYDILRSKLDRDNKIATIKFKERTSKAGKEFAKEIKSIGKDIKNNSVKTLVKFGKETVSETVGTIKKVYHKSGEIIKETVGTGQKFGSAISRASVNYKTQAAAIRTTKTGLGKIKDLTKLKFKFGKETVGAGLEFTKDFGKLTGKYSKEGIETVLKNIKESFVGDCRKVKTCIEFGKNLFKKKK